MLLSCPVITSRPASGIYHLLADPSRTGDGQQRFHYDRLADHPNGA